MLNPQKCLHTLLIVIVNAISISSAHSAVQIAGPTQVQVFQMHDYTLTLPADWTLPDRQIHDAYDADRNNQFIRIIGIFRHSKSQKVLRIPAFAMKDQAGGPWAWRIRWTATLSGEWTVSLHCALRAAKMFDVLEHEQKNILHIHAQTKGNAQRGFLRYPDIAANQRYFQISDSNGAQHAELLYGNCRAWMVAAHKNNTEKKGTWQAEEWADRSQELLPTLREGGYNVLNTWFAPWEYNIIHCDQAEYWRQDDDNWKRQTLSNDWSAYQSYDQGRARHFDQFLRQCEGTPDQERIYLLLAPLSHVSFQQRAHPWGGEGHWSQADDPKQAPEKLNGFSLVPGQKEFWDFFKADPMAPTEDWRSKLFDHQANYFRYIIARWGASPSIGLWELFDEIDAIGDRVGLVNMKQGWWNPAHNKHNKKWLENITHLFTGNLRRKDALIYAGDAYQHPLHVATTSHAGEYSEIGNMRWTDIPAHNMTIGWHWYPFPSQKEIGSYWVHCIRGIQEFSKVWGNKRPHFISEFGNYDRTSPDKLPAMTYPSLYHFGIWSSAFSGQAITVMDWDDGKEYGELRWRQRKVPQDKQTTPTTPTTQATQTESAFSKKNYPIDNVSRMQALRLFTADIDWNSVKRMGDLGFTTMHNDTSRSLSHILFTNAGAHAWAFIADDHYQSHISGLTSGEYTLQFYDPWTGLPIAKAQKITVDASGNCIINAGVAMKIIKIYSHDFNSINEKTQEKNRLFRGYDIAWKLLRKTK